MTSPNDQMELRDSPWVVRFRCHYCQRSGDIRLASLAWRYGAHATLAQEALFLRVQPRAERHVPAGHWVRAIDRFVDLSEIRTHLRPFYSEKGRRSIDPELMIRMLLIGYCFGIRSERRLARRFIST